MIDTTSRKVDPTYFDPVGDILHPRSINETMQHSVSYSNQGNSVTRNPRRKSNFVKQKLLNLSIDWEPQRLTQDLLPHLEYAFLEDDTRIPLKIASSRLEKSAKNVKAPICVLTGEEHFNGQGGHLSSALKFLKKWRCVHGKRKLSTFRGCHNGPTGGIMVLTYRKKIFDSGFFGHIYKDATSLSKTVTRANDKEKLRNGMRCLKTPSKFVKSLTFGALTVWAVPSLKLGQIYSRGR
ncbi:hypothetical protein Tco_1212605 [Tanacetum coccineum]